MAAAKMAPPTCYLARLDREETVQALRQALAGMNAAGLRVVVNCLLAAMYRAAVSGQTLDHVLEHEVSEVHTQTIVHIHRHVMHHLLRERAPDAGQDAAWRN